MDRKRQPVRVLINYWQSKLIYDKFLMPIHVPELIEDTIRYLKDIKQEEETTE